MNETMLELTQQLEAERKVSSAISELSKAIISPVLTNNDIYQMVLDQARELTNSDHGFVSSIDPKSGAHVSHTLTQMKAEGCSVPLTEGVLPEGPHKRYDGLWGVGLNIREPFFTNNPQAHPEAKGLPAGHVPLKNFLSVPVVFQGQLLGQIALANSTRDFKQSDIETIEKLAAFYAVVLQNHLWGKELQTANETLQNNAVIQLVLREIAEAALLTSSVEELYRRVHLLLGRVLPAQRFHINLLDESTNEIVVPFQADDVTFIPTRRPVDKGMTEYIMKQGRAVHITPSDLERLIETGEYALAKVQNVLERHYLGAPLIDAQGKAFGVMSLITLGHSHPFQPRDVEVLSIIATQVSMAIERKQMEQELELHATIDELTGIYNRRYFLSRASEELYRIGRYGGTCSMLMIDIDHFKTVNDRFGHAVGDAAIQRITKICSQSLRKSDYVGRIGGEEFALLLLETGLAEAALIAERLRERIQEDTFGREQGINCELRVSIGVAERLSMEESLAALMNRADEALYQAKREGRNRIVTAS